jgi:hypothetical protein
MAISNKLSDTQDNFINQMMPLRGYLRVADFN